MSITLKDKKSPNIARGFFLYTILLDFVILFFSSLKLFLLLEFVLFQTIYFFYLKGSLKKILSIFILSLIIFIFNVFQISGGKTLFVNNFIVLTETSFFLAIEKALVLFSLFLISSNCIYQNRSIFLSQDKSSLLTLSIQKFFYLFERIKFKNGKVLKNVYCWFYRSLFCSLEEDSKISVSLKSFFCFHLIFFTLMLSSIFFFSKV